MEDWEAGIKTMAHAQAYFRAMGCSHFHMLREFPERYEEYRAMNVLDSIEKAWIQMEIDIATQKVMSLSGEKNEFWLRQSYISDLCRLAQQHPAIRHAYEITAFLQPHVPPEDRVLVAEDIVGRGADGYEGGLISAALKYSDHELAKAFAELAREYCKRTADRKEGPPVSKRVEDVHARLRKLLP